MSQTGAASERQSTRPALLLERDRELGVLEDLVAGAVSGRAATVVVEGAAGIGKSRVLVAARGAAKARGVRVLTARAGELERELPFGVVRQLFEPLMEEDDWFAGAGAAARAVVSPPAVAGPVEESFAALHGLYWLTANVAADRPLMLAIDDLQWSDRTSLRFLAYLVRRVEGLPILVAATLRSGEAAADPALLGEVLGDPLTTMVSLRALSPAGVAELVRARLGDDAEPAFCATCHEATGGNPLLVCQLISALAAEAIEPRAANAAAVQRLGPRAVSRTVLLRLARLPEDVRRVARAVAILGDGADVTTVAALVELDAAFVAEASGALARADILRPDAPLAFVHA
ncbi:MAG TPA: AAA family ATPase, partial [Solirubrobacteraceae bacterium]|nr:AAA family ATPase [Solirubrobacteraceae bacterium]